MQAGQPSAQAQCSTTESAAARIDGCSSKKRSHRETPHRAAPPRATTELPPDRFLNVELSQLAFNERLLEAVNSRGEVFLSHTRLHDRFVLRLAIGNLRTTEAHVARAWSLLQETALQLRTSV